MTNIRKTSSVILVAGGSGHLGRVCVEHLLKQQYKVFNYSSRVSNIHNPNLVERVGDLNDSMWLNSQFEADAGVNSFYGILNFAGRSKRVVVGENEEGNPLDAANLDTNISLSLIRLFIDFPNFFVSNSRYIDIGSIWASQIPFSPTYLDLDNEPSLSVLLSKASKKKLIQYYAKVLGPSGVQLNQIAPGWFPKPSMTPRLDYIKGIESRIPFARIGNPKELLSAFDFLLSPETTYITGQEIIVDGGFSIY